MMGQPLYINYTIENGPVEIVDDYPSKSELVDLSSSFFVNVYQAGYVASYF